MLLKITKYSHHFSCDTPFTQVRNFLNDFAHQYAEKEVKKVKGRIQISYPKVYASINVNRTSFRFHINTFHQFIDFMIRYNFPTNQYQVVTAEGFDPDDSDMNITAPYPPHDYQVPLIEYLCDTGIQKVLSLQTGKGKAMSVNTPVLTPTGWRPIGDLQPNDMVVTPDGSEVKVLSIHPQGKLPTVIFDFGHSVESTSSLEHLWEVKINGEVQVLTSEEIIGLFNTGTEVFIPRVDVLDDYTVTNERWVKLLDITSGEVTECVCISIDHPRHCYITEHGIVTHNTFTALHAIARTKKRTVIVLPGKYVERWVGDLCGKDKVLDLTTDDVRLVRGSAAMITLLEDGVAGNITEKVIIITATTLYNYYKAYNENSVDYESYPCPPYDMYKVLGAGIRIIDEVHENIHLNYTQDLFTHIYKTISLSATLEFDNKTTDRMCNILFPKSMQVNNGEWDKYINCIGLYYELDQPTKLRWTAPGMGSYSHTTFEMSLLKRPQSLKKYTDMIVDLINNICIKKRDPDDKILIFAATKDMCTHLTNAFKNQWPLMTINRYVGEDDYENLISAEMVVSTLLSAGTAVDIPGLRYVLMTTARRSSQSNIQALGRLRQMKKKPDVNPEFYYLINRDIPKHIEYHKHKMEIFKDKVLNHKTMETHYRV